MVYDNNNIFAKILHNEVPSKRVYEDEFVLAFHDTNPKASTHVLVIPKGAYVDAYHFFAQAPKSLQTGFLLGLNNTVDALAVRTEGFRLVANTGKNACQEVPHFHMHILAGQALSGTFG